MAQGGQCGPGIIDLMCAGQHRERQIQKPAFILINQPVAFFIDMPMLTVDKCWGLQTLGDSFDHLKRFVGLWTDHTGHAGFDNAGLFSGDFGECITKKLFVVDRHRSNDAKCGSVDYICSVKPSAKAHLKQGVICRAARHRQQCSAGSDLEVGDRAAGIGVIAFI